MATTTPRHWTYWLLVVLAAEKIVQHATVTAALLADWQAIRATVAVDYHWLAVTGAAIGALFVLALIGLLHDRRWSLGLLTALALADIIGEFVAQGRLGITVTVSFIVALAILLLAQWRSKAAV